MKKTLLLLIMVAQTMVMYAQRTVSGKVTDASGQALGGVSVTISGTTRGTLCDFDGKYSLSVGSAEDVLEFSFLGYKSQQIVVGNQSTIDVQLSEDISKLDEVLVVGYGTQLKTGLTGNIAKVSGKEIQNIPVPSLEEALQGKAAGVFIEANNGKVGGANRMRIRGSSSIGASNQPLFVIDGIPLALEALNVTGAPTNPLSEINFNDIESVEILKDASASAIYGSRAANGVVLITTKKGKSGVSKINFNLQAGFSDPTNKREFMNSEEFLAHFREAAANADIIEDDNFWAGFVEGRFDRYSGHAGKRDANGKFVWTGDPVETDWQDQAFRRGNNLLADVSAQGGTDKLKYFASLGYNKTEGILLSNDFERFSGRLNVENNLNRWMDVGLNFNLSRTVINQVSADNAFSTPMQLVALAPITPIRNLNGQLYDRPTTTYYNGLIDTEDATRSLTTFRNITNGFLNIKLMKDLSWRSELGYDLSNLKENGRYGVKTEIGQRFNGYGLANYGQIQNLLTKSYLSYNKGFGQLNMNAIGGIEFQQTSLDRAEVEGRDFALDDLRTLASAGEIFGGTSTLNEYSFLSYFSRFNFDYQNKFLLTLSGRVDGSSRFGENRRFGFFPAVSAGYVMTEDFLKDNNVVSFLKLRASYGRTGNAAIGNFDHLGLYSTGTYNNQPGLFPGRIANPDLGWEQTGQLDVGVDFGMFNDRITGEIDYYNKVTSDLLLNVPVPGTSGFEIQRQNIGGMRNSGIEVVLNSNNLTGKFKWNTSLNMAFNRNEVTNLGDRDLIDDGSSRFMNVVKVGQPLGVFLGAEYAGVDPANGDALWFINDPENPGRQTTNDFNEANFIELGNPTPWLIGGITNSFSYKGFDLSFTLQGVYGNKIHMAGDPFMACNGCWFDNQTRDQLESWKKPGDVTNVPQARLGYSNGDQARSSRYLSDGSYLRLRTLVLGYEVPKRMLGNRGLDRLRFYVMGQNLLTFTKFIGWDPEVSTDFAVNNVVSGVDFYSAPQPRTITFGINVGF
jgi:TonB-dependent starch-binding outer membrane protein SusC